MNPVTPFEFQQGDDFFANSVSRQMKWLKGEESSKTGDDGYHTC